MSENVLVIGSGGREHAIIWKISQSSYVKNIYAAPGSHAISLENKVKIADLNVKNFEEVTSFCKTNDISLVIVGPENPLASGIADVLEGAGISVFGPTKDAAQIESDKDWAKAFMDRHNIPTARWKSFTQAKEAKDFINNAGFPALVVKASGLAAGKGVVVASDKQEACRAVDDILTNKKFGTAGSTVVIEELLTGEEVSMLAFCDGNTVRPMLPAQDHKRIFDNDKGPNTGGMGAYCPCPLLDKHMDFVESHVLQRALDGFKKQNIKFVGVLYAGLMLTPDGPRVLEFNCRFGDPETEVILPLLDSDLYLLMNSCCNGTLKEQNISWKHNLTAVGVVMASKGYPETSSKGQVITEIDKVNEKDQHVVFHCGTAVKDGHIVTNGGRVLIVVSLAQSLTIAAARATKACGQIKFDGAQYRKDIAHKGIARFILESGKLTYKQSGVDITAGNDLITHIKPSAKSTTRSGAVGSLGGFGGLFDVQAAGFEDPVLVSGTDGVGTKLKIAQMMNIHDTIGIDLVAMCVNDVLAHGAEPLFFLDYFACGRLDISIAKTVIDGVVEGCKQAGCALLGGETAEMPDIYPPGEYDLAGFSVGAVEKSQIMPHVYKIKSGDVVIGLPSSGVHSNGFSLVRKVMAIADVDCKNIAPFSEQGKTFGEELLTPTKIYVKAVIPAVNTGKVKAFAHITGGGLLENIPRILPETLAVELDAKNWNIPPVFPWLATAGGINKFEMLRTFNCGVGGVLIVSPEHEAEVMSLVAPHGATKIGFVTEQTQGYFYGDQTKEQVVVNNFCEVMEASMRKYVPDVVTNAEPSKKRIGVLISGSGTNLQALIDATQDPSKRTGAEIVLVLSNKEGVQGLERAQKAGIPTKVISHKNYPTRAEYDRHLHNELASAGVEFVCLAGFMRILSGEFVSKWRGRLINIHPALLPSFKGTHAQKQAIEAGVHMSGCTVHFVEEDIDAGAIITQMAVPVHPDDTEETLTERIKTAEHVAYPKALQMLATGKVRLGDDNRLVWAK